MQWVHDATILSVTQTGGALDTTVENDAIRLPEGLYMVSIQAAFAAITGGWVSVYASLSQGAREVLPVSDELNANGYNGLTAMGVIRCDGTRPSVSVTIGGGSSGTLRKPITIDIVKIG